MQELIHSCQYGAHLWWQGLWESLQLHRCIVFFVKDDSKALWSRTLQCFTLNGCIFLVSVAWWQAVLQPASTWLLTVTGAPLLGPVTVSTLQGLISALYHGLWLVPAYVVTLLVSCAWYQDMATMAMRIQQQAQLAAGAGANGVGAAGIKAPVAVKTGSAASSSGSSSSSSMSGLDTAAQEVFRVILFLIFYTEVSLLAMLPYIGRPLHTIFLSWLYAYYCFDYKWAIQGVRLHTRLDSVEHHWAFFAGFGTLMSLMTVLLPFYSGAGISALAFPLFVLVACDANPPQLAAHHQQQHAHAASANGGAVDGPTAAPAVAACAAAGAAGASAPAPCLPRLPIFTPALQPAQRLVAWLLGPQGAAGSGGGGGGWSSAFGKKQE